MRAPPSLLVRSETPGRGTRTHLTFVKRSSRFSIAERFSVEKISRIALHSLDTIPRTSI